MNYSAHLEHASAAYWNRVNVIAEAVRQDLVIPFCDKHRFQFTAGMGTWTFWDGKSTSTIKGSYEIERMRGTKRLLKALTLEVENRSVDLGCLVNDYTPKGWGQ